MISAHAQSSKVQTNSLYVWMQLKTTYFQTFLELLVSLPFSTCCSRLWPKEVLPIADFAPHSVLCQHSMEGELVSSSPQIPLSPWGLFPARVHLSNLRVEGPQHIRTNSPKCLSLVWESVIRVGRIACNLFCKRLQIIPNYSPFENF